MKKICSLLIGSILLLSSCKKNHPDQKVPLLSRATSNGVTIYRFYYNSSNLLSKIELYDDLPGNPLNSYYAITYNNSSEIDQISRITMPGEIPSTRLVYTYDLDGRVSKSEEYDLQGMTPNAPAYTLTFTYNTAGLLTSHTAKDKSNVFLSKVNYLHYPDGKLKELQLLKEQNSQLQIVTKETFSVPVSGDRPGGLDEIEKVLGPEFTAPFFYESFSSLTYNQANVVTNDVNYLFSGREYNDDNTLKKQVLTVKYNKPANADVIIYKDYEYILR